VWNWTKKLFSLSQPHNSKQPHSPGRVVLNFHTDFRLTFVRNKVKLAGPQPRPLQTVGRRSALGTRFGCLVHNSRQYSPTTTKVRIDCVVCHAHTKNIRRIQPKCEKCNTGLCISIRFKDYHTKAQFYVVSHNNGLHKEIITYTEHLKVCNNFCTKKHFSDNTSCTLFLSCAMFHSCTEYLRVQTAGSF
jgi:hypothetical protein